MREWTGPEIKTFRTMYAEKKSYREIARAIGKSRSAISGRARRMMEAGTIDRVHEPVVRKSKGFVFGEGPQSRIKSDPVPMPEPEPPSDTTVSMMELSSSMCRWPVSDTPRLFCGAKAFKGSWCEYHAGRVWVQGSLVRKPNA